MATASRSRNRIVAVATLALFLFGVWLLRRQDASAPLSLDHSVTDAPPSSTERSLLAPPENARANDRAGASVPIATEVGSETDARTPMLRGRVIDDLGDPVTRFQLDLRQRGDEAGFEEELSAMGPLTAERVDPEGAFVVASMPAGDWSVSARRGSGARSASVAIVAPYSGDPLVLVLARDASLRGLVLDATEQPVEAAEILLTQDPKLRRNYTGRAVVAARSDASGAFAIAAAPSGRTYAMARRAGSCDSEWTEVVLEPGGNAHVTLRMREGGRIVGVVDPSLGRTSDREIGLYSFQGTVGWRDARSDASGRFEIEDVIPQPYVIELRALEGVSPDGDAGGSVRKRIEVLAGKTTEVVLGEVRPAIEVRGVLMLPRGPAAGFEVRAMPTDGGEDRQVHVTSGANGEFVLEVPGEGEYSFAVSRGQGSYTWVVRKIAAPGPVDIVLELPGGSIRGRVISPDGKPLARMPVTAIRPPDPGEDPRRNLMKRFARTKTDENGEFELGLLSPGTYTVRAPDGYQSDRPPDRTPFGHALVSGCVVRDAPIQPLEIRLTAEAFVAGRVVDATGAPVADAWLMLLDSDGHGATARYAYSTDARGEFALPSVAPGAYTLEVVKGEARTSSSAFVVRAGSSTTVDVVLR